MEGTSSKQGAFLLHHNRNDDDTPQDALEPLAMFRDMYASRLQETDSRRMRVEQMHRLINYRDKEIEAAKYPWELAEGEELDRYNRAAIVIQRAYRAHLARKAARQLQACADELARLKLLELARHKANAQRVLKQQAKDLLLALYAQAQYNKTRERIYQAKGVLPGQVALDCPTIDPAVWRGVIEMGMDPYQVLVSAGLNAPQIQMVLEASGIDYNSSANPSSGGSSDSEQDAGAASLVRRRSMDTELDKVRMSRSSSGGSGQCSQELASPAARPASGLPGGATRPMQNRRQVVKRAPNAGLGSPSLPAEPQQQPLTRRSSDGGVMSAISLTSYGCLSDPATIPAIPTRAERHSSSGSAAAAPALGVARRSSGGDGFRRNSSDSGSDDRCERSAFSLPPLARLRSASPPLHPPSPQRNVPFNVLQFNAPASQGSLGGAAGGSRGPSPRVSAAGGSRGPSPQPQRSTSQSGCSPGGVMYSFGDRAVAASLEGSVGCLKPSPPKHDSFMDKRAKPPTSGELRPPRPGQTSPVSVSPRPPSGAR